MALVDVDSWFTEFEACQRLNHTILTQLVERDKRQVLSNEYNRLTANLTVGLNQFETELKQLKIKLDASANSRSITFEEIERRQRQVYTLSSQFQQVQKKFIDSTRSDRSKHLDESSSSGSVWQTLINEENKPTGDTKNVETFQQRQNQMLEDQNAGLDALSQTISRQRELATQLGQEVDDQNDILTNLANTMERVDARVNIETGNISVVNRRDTTWGYWLVIVVLFVVIVILAIV